VKWRKLGKIFCADRNSDWMYSHAMIPIAEKFDEELYRIYFSPRDKFNRGHGAYLEIDIRNPTKVIRLHDKPILRPGALGCFDDSGALPNSIVRTCGRKILYYTGINLGVTVKIRNSIGLAEWNDQTHRFERCFEGPIIDRTRHHPHFVATPEVLYEDRYRAWFTSCVGWSLHPDGPRHHYHIEYAESKDGVAWERNGIVAIDFQDEFEYAIGAPRVIKDGAVYKMWFCSRATSDYPAYRIRYATSSDGIKWARQDNIVGIDVSLPGEWDSQMLCYPFVFDHLGERYMLYNGNDFGRTGFGIAVLENQ
jgi:hypothetical protein